MPPNFEGISGFVTIMIKETFMLCSYAIFFMSVLSFDLFHFLFHQLFSGRITRRSRAIRERSSRWKTLCLWRRYDCRSSKSKLEESGAFHISMAPDPSDSLVGSSRVDLFDHQRGAGQRLLVEGQPAAKPLFLRRSWQMDWAVMPDVCDIIIGR